MKIEKIICAVLISCILNIGFSALTGQSATGIINPVEDLNIGIATQNKSHTQVIKDVLQGVIPGIRSTMISLAPGVSYRQPSTTDEDFVFMVLGGKGEIKSDGKKYKVVTETIAHFPVGRSTEFTASGSDGLDILLLSLTLTPPDREDLAAHKDLNTVVYIKRFKDCEPYSESIKSAKTVSRTLLPKDIVPRMAIGTVETTGPDKVAPHRHPMLEQYFLGLSDNNITVLSDSSRTNLKSNEIFHIPTGSNHGADVEEGSKLYYIWMDFFQDRKGLEWLNVHKPIKAEK